MWNEKSFEQMVQEELDIFGRYFDPCIMSYKKFIWGGLQLIPDQNNSSYKPEEEAVEHLHNFGAKISQMGSATTNHKIKSWYDRFCQN